MTRKQPSPPPAVKPVDDARMETQVREYELITPLFGGGAAAQQADAISVVRVPSIRGQLRFWWRACRGANETGDLVKMRAAEEKIWGMAGSDKPTPSSVNLRLELLDEGVTQRAGEVRDVDYAIFPLRANPRENKPEGSVVTGVKFALHITYPKTAAKDVEAALWAWETFGGLGARTRRGLGAIRCVKIGGQEQPLPAGKAALEASIRDGLKQHLAAGRWPDNTPHLTATASFKVTPPQPNVKAAWVLLVKKLREFRQYRTGSPGRSHWPEPDAIRDITNQRSLPHSEPVVRGVKKFPRAQFGLPIIFHFKDRGDPFPDLTLQGGDISPEKKVDRYASRLLLRPVLCQNGQACGLAIILEGPRYPAKGLALKQSGRPDWTVPGNLADLADLADPAETSLITPLKGKTNKTDVLQAFLETL